MKKAYLSSLFLVLATLLLPAANAYADFNDRINQCERNGGGSCMFDLIRELANGNRDRGNGGGYGGGNRPLQLEEGIYVRGNGTGCNSLEVLAASPAAVRIRYCNATLNYKCEKETCTVAGTQYANDAPVIMSSRTSFTKGPSLWIKQ